MSTPINTGFKVNAAEPIDERTTRALFAELALIEKPYNGLETYVAATDKYYKYKDGSWTQRAVSVAFGDVTDRPFINGHELTVGDHNSLTDLGVIEAIDGGVVAGRRIEFPIEGEGANGVITEFSAITPFVPGTVVVFHKGLRLVKGVDFEEMSDKLSIKFLLKAPDPTDSIVIEAIPPKAE